MVNSDMEKEITVTATITRTKIVIKDLGDPKAVLADDAPSPMLMGTLIGIVEKTKTKVAQNGDTFEALIGTFEAKRATETEMTVKDETDAERKVMVDTLRSGVCYLPAALHDPIAEAMKADNNLPQQFGLSVSVQKASNKAGFEYVINSFLAPTRADPLASVRTHIPAVEKPEKPKAKAA